MNGKIFIIENDINVLHGLRTRLIDSGFSVEADSAGGPAEQIVVSARRHAPDYIIADVFLPHINDNELLHAIKRQDDLARVPLFIFADYGSDRAAERYRIMGADYMLRPSLNFDELVLSFLKIINNKLKTQKI